MKISMTLSSYSRVISSSIVKRRISASFTNEIGISDSKSDWPEVKMISMSVNNYKTHLLVVGPAIAVIVPSIVRGKFVIPFTLSLKVVFSLSSSTTKYVALRNP